MAEQERPQKHGSGFFRLFEQGVDTATRNNVTAYGYSVSITAAFAYPANLSERYRDL